MNQPANKAWQQLKMFERRGDLKKQFEILRDVLGSQVTPQVLSSTYETCRQNAIAIEKRDPPLAWSMSPETHRIEIKKAYDHALVKDIIIPRETNAEPFEDLNWSKFAQVKLLVLNTDGGRIQIVEKIKKFNESPALLMNSGYAYLNEYKYHAQSMNIFLDALYHDSIPLENVESLPFDLSVSPKHSVVALTNRGANKIHLYHRENYRLVKTWKIPAPPTKAFSIAYHPDGKRIFVGAYETGTVYCIDRQMVMKKIWLKSNKIFSAIKLSPRGDQLIVYAINEKTHRPDLDFYDLETQKLINTVTLEGEAFSQGADAKDLLTLTPDGQWAIAMVSKNQPALFTPTLQLINMKSGKVTDTQALNGQEKPLHIGFLARQLTPPKITLLKMLLHTQGIDEDIIKNRFGITSL